MITHFLFLDHFNTDWVFSAKAEFNKSKTPSSHLNLITHLLCPTTAWELSNFPIPSFSQNLTFCITSHFCLPAGTQHSNHQFSAFPSCLYSLIPVPYTKSTTVGSDFLPAVWHKAWPAPVQHCCRTDDSSTLGSLSAAPVEVLLDLQFQLSAVFLTEQ